MKVKIFLACLVLGVVLAVAGSFCAPSPKPDIPQPLIEDQQEEPTNSRAVIATVLEWSGYGFIVVGGIGLVFCGVHRSALLGRPGY